MKIPFVRMHVFWTPWWDVDHHLYDCPIEIYVHTPRWNLGIRPFSNFAQGGDRRGALAWRETREGPSPYEREQVARWELADEPPEIWDRLGTHRCRCRFCVWCLHDEQTCRMCGGHDGKAGRSLRPERYVRRGAFLRHLWLMHVRERHHCGLGRDVKEWIEIETRGESDDG